MVICPTVATRSANGDPIAAKTFQSNVAMLDVLSFDYSVVSWCLKIRRTGIDLLLLCVRLELVIVYFAVIVLQADAPLCPGSQLIDQCASH